MRMAIDWVNEIGPETYIIYGHYKCNKEFLTRSQMEHDPEFASAAEMMGHLASIL